MTDTPEQSDNDPEKTEAKAKTTAEKVTNTVVKSAEMAEKVGSTTAEVANNAFGAVKWVAIAVVAVSLVGGGYGLYKMVSSPVEAVSDAAGAVAEKVGEGADAIKEGTSRILNRLDIPSTSQRSLNKNANAAFETLFNLKKTRAGGPAESMFRRTNFNGSKGKVCKFDLDFGGGELEVFAAADVDAHETAASLGSLDDRLIRMIIKTNDDIKFNAIWDEDLEIWIMKWKSTTVKKPLNDDTAEARMMDVLQAVPKKC